MTTDVFSARQFESEAEIRRLGLGLLDCSLQRADWTHEAHFAATLYLLVNKPELALEAELPGLIRRFNESVGGQNTDTAGYHETLTQFYIGLMRDFVRNWSEAQDLLALTNALVRSESAGRDYPLNFWTREALYSVAARRGWLAPDLAALPFPIRLAAA